MQTSTIKFSQIEDRLDAEYYKLEYLANDNRLFSGGFWRLENLVSKPITYGHTPNQQTEGYVEDGVIFIRSAELNNFFIDTSKSIKINQKIHDQLSRSKITSGDVLLATVGATIGACGIASYDLNEANCNQAIAVIHPKKDISGEFLAIVLSSSCGQLQIQRFCSGGARENLDPFEVKALKIPRLPRSTIKDITKRVKSSYQKYQIARQKYQEAQYLLEKFLKIDEQKLNFKNCFSLPFSKMADRIDGEYYKPKYFKASEILKNSGYKIIKLGDIASKVYYGTSQKVIYQKQGVPFLRVSEIDDFETIEPENGKFISKTEADVLQSYAVKQDDLLISRTGTLGSIVYISEKLAGSIFGSYFIKVVPKKDASILPLFVSIFLNSEIGKLQSKRFASGGIQTNLTIKMIKSLEIPVLNKKDQDKMCHSYSEAIMLRQESKKLLEQAKQEVEQLIEK